MELALGRVPKWSSSPSSSGKGSVRDRDGTYLIVSGHSRGRGVREPLRIVNI